MTPEDLYDLRRDPTFNQLKNAFNGHLKQEEQRAKTLRNFLFGAARYNAANTAFSEKQARGISRQKFPWEEGHKKGGEPMNAKQIYKMLEFISKPEKKN